MILLGEQIVKFKDGTQKTLEDFVSESSGGGGTSKWEKLCEFTANNNTAIAWPEEMQSFFNDPQYNEIMIFIANKSSTNTNVCTSLVLPADELIGDNIVNNIINLAMGNTTLDSYQYAINLTTVKDGDTYKVTPFWNYTPAFSAGLKVKIYVR